jgi:hypothetical protein
MNLFALSGLLNALVGGFLIFLALFRGTKVTHVTFSVFSGFVFLWSSFYFLWQVETQADMALIYCRILMMGAIPIPALFFHYSVVLSDSQNRYRHWIQLAYVLSGAFMASNLFGYIVARVEPRGSFAFWPVPGFLLPYQLVFFGTTVVVFLYVLYCGCREATGVRREQIRYVFIGALLSFGGGLTNYFWWFNVPVDPWGNFLVFFGRCHYRLWIITLPFNGY